MPFATREGTRLYWRQEGSSARPTLVLLNAIGTDMSLWDALMPVLLSRFQILRFDARGHGASDAPPGDYTLRMLAEDVIAVMDAAKVGRAALVGLSLGGMIAMETALQHPERVTALALICTSARVERDPWVTRVKEVRASGVAAIADAAMARFFSPPFVKRFPERAGAARRTLLTTEGYAGAAAAIRDADLGERIAAIKVPTLVVSANQDVSMPFTPHSEFLLAHIAGSQSSRIDGGHLAAYESPSAVAQAIGPFFARDEKIKAAEQELFNAGIANRRQVLGHQWVDQALAMRTDFDADFQEMITRIAWHEIWGRAGLDERTRRLLVIAITASLGRWEEFSLHARAGLERGGFSREELKEALMQLAIYAGVPAANTAFKEARRILQDLDAADSSPSDQP